jgi:hypothetical protein
MSVQEKAERTQLPPLATWNAMVVVNPMLGKVLAKALDYSVLKSLNDFPYEGKVLTASISGTTGTVTIDRTALGLDYDVYVAIPFVRFTIAASTLNAAPGSQVTIDFEGEDYYGKKVNTRAAGKPKYSYTFQRINNTEAVLGIFIPTQVISTRTLPFLPVVGEMTGGVSIKQMVIRFDGISAQDQIYVTIPGYATAELKEISAMYNLPSGMIR